MSQLWNQTPNNSSNGPTQNSAIPNVTNNPNSNATNPNIGDKHVVLPSFSNLNQDNNTQQQVPHHIASINTSSSPVITQPSNLDTTNVNQPQHSTNSLSVASFDNPLPPQQQLQQQQQQSDDPYYRPLNVKDALTYLEQVKLQFSSRPDIYNHFLDIMKDFKSQSIDTPGVIERVSTLFRGYPTLIQGFNTFLPQGYTIECSANPDDPIKVTTPIGSQIVSTTDKSISINNVAMPIVNNNAANAPVSNPAIASSSTSTTPTATTITTTTKILNNEAEKPADVEFSQAVSYVNKIKNRFADQPDIYKNFLEILQTYQREQKPINEVYAQVTILFQSAPDLLNDFKKFLPDSSPSTTIQQQPQVQTILTQQPNIYGMTNYYQQGGNIPSTLINQNLPPLGNFSPPANGNVPGHPEDFRHENQTNTMSLPSIVQQPNDQAQLHHPPQHQLASTSTNETIPISDMRSPMIDNSAANYSQMELAEVQLQQQMQMEGRYTGEVSVRPEIDLDPSIVPVIPEPTEPIEDSLSLVEETNFFDKAKKFIGNKQIYIEFLKILNLYSQDILDIDQLVEKVGFYLGSNKELFEWFKKFVGFQDKPKHLENVVHEKHKLDLDLCEACGPSYKKLPKTDTFMPCSGRDEMCWDVLNDEWVGHPVWASEDSGFIAHRKNQYEETLFKIEEERHEYDFYIESNLRTIQTLETIASKIANMTDEEKSTFKLPLGLGHTSMTIYQKVIRKVYDKERGFEILDALHEYPAVAVPVVLKRLKQKDEEWRRAQREWNKVWRELEQKVFFKSLDHLGLTFKQSDKKLLTTKQLVSEISSIKTDQTNKRIHWLTPKPKTQLDYTVKDSQVLFDILRLTDVFIGHTANYSNPDKERLRDFLQSFISLFFSIPITEVQEAIRLRDSEANPTGESESSSLSSSKKRSREVEIPLRDILSRVKYQKLKHGTETNENIYNESSSEQKGEDNKEEIVRQEAKKPWLLGSLVEEANSQGVINNRTTFNIFANSNIYVFIRHLVTVYERLFEVKEMNEEVTKEINSRNVVQFAKDLNLVSTQLKTMGLDFAGNDSYAQLLLLSKRLIEGELDHQWFEESIRQAYKNKAFKLYTVDKVIQSLVKYAHTIITDAKTAEIMVLFEKDRNMVSTSSKEQILYRLQTRSHMSNTENMFRIDFNKKTAHTSIQYIALDDLTLDEPKTLEDKWKYYVTSYSLSHPTEGIAQNEIRIPFLEKIIEAEQEFIDEEGNIEAKYSPEGISKSNLKIKINPETYVLEIEPASQDVFSRKSINKYPINVSNELYKNMKQKKNDHVKTYLNGKHGWKKNLSDVTIQNAEEKYEYLKKNGSLKDFMQKPINPSDGTQVKDENIPAKAPAKEVPAATEVEERGNDTTTEEVDNESIIH